MPILLCACTAALLFVDVAAQSRPDFSGRWVLTAPPPADQSAGITPADELEIAQSATSITIAHPSKAGTHPRRGPHVFGSHGTVGSGGARSTTDTFWFGDQLIMGSETLSRSDATGEPAGVESSEMWALDRNGQLVIEVREKRSGAPARSATLVYRKR